MVIDSGFLRRRFAAEVHAFAEGLLERGAGEAGGGGAAGLGGGGGGGPAV